MNVIEFYNRMKEATVGLPDWLELHPQHQHLIVTACNCLLQVCHDNGVVGKNTEDKS